MSKLGQPPDLKKLDSNLFLNFCCFCKQIYGQEAPECGSTTCQCSISCNSTHASSSDLSVQRSLDIDHRLCGADALSRAQLTKTTQRCTQKFSRKEIHRGIDNGSRHSCGSVNAKPSLSPITRKCGRCGSITCQCNSYLSVQRSLDRDHRLCGVDTSVQARSMSVSQMSKSDPNSDGAVSALDDENTCLSSQLMAPTIDAASQGGWSAPDFAVQLSPKKALRAALLKSRFAETTLKAQHKTLLDHSDKVDPLKMQQEKQRLERRQREGEFCKLILALCIKIQMHYSFVRVMRSFDLSSEGITLTV